MIFVVLTGLTFVLKYINMLFRVCIWQLTNDTTQKEPELILEEDFRYFIFLFCKYNYFVGFHLLSKTHIYFDFTLLQSVFFAAMYVCTSVCHTRFFLTDPHPFLNFLLLYLGMFYLNRQFIRDVYYQIYIFGEKMLNLSM